MKSNLAKLSEFSHSPSAASTVFFLIKQWPLSQYLPDSTNTHANLARQVTFFPKMYLANMTSIMKWHLKHFASFASLANIAISVCTYCTCHTYQIHQSKLKIDPENQ
jgi:hypothetical protein